jgi:DNA-binding NtrC family response regulator
MAEPEGQSKPTVLIVEDDDQMRAMLEMMLSRMGCKTRAVSRATEALRPIERGEANLLLLDLQMPGVTGIDLLRTLKRRNLTMPTVVVSAFISAEAAKSCAELGVRGMVAKPFDQGRLVAEIQKQLSQVGFRLKADN